MSVGTGLMGSRSVACITTETLSGSEEEEDVILSLTEMVSLHCPFTITIGTQMYMYMDVYFSDVQSV